MHEHTSKTARTRLLRRGLPVVLAAVLWTTGLVAPTATPARPIVDSKVHDLADSAVAPGRSVAVETDIPTNAVGLDWDGSLEGAVEIRVQEGDAWGPWTRVEGEPTEGPDRSSREYHPRTSAGPVWVGEDVGKVEVRVVEGDLRRVKLHAIRSEQPPPSGGTRPAGSLVPQPGIVSRAAWGADESYRNLNPGCSQPEYADSVRFSVVHHTVDRNTYTAAEAPAMIRAIYHFHTHSNKWCDIGYNLLVDRFGQVYEGRFGGLDRPVVGAHAQGFNSGSTGVALLGNFVTDPVPPVMYDALRRVMAWKLAYHGINPQSTVATPARAVPAVSGHRDLNATECPGAIAYGLLNQLRGDLAGDIRSSTRKPVLARSGTFLLKTWPTTGVADSAFGYGNPGDATVMGDWDGNGTRTPALFRGGLWLLRNSNTTGVHDVAFGFGDPGDLPVAGDWNGDGIDTPGLLRGNLWLLRNSNTTGVHDVAFHFGDAGDRPLAGDWNGDRVDTPGLFRSGTWHLRNSNTTGRADAVYGFGNPGDLPAVADWNGDGTDTGGLLRGNVWYLRNSNTTGRGDVSFGFGSPGDKPGAWS